MKCENATFLTKKWLSYEQLVATGYNPRHLFVLIIKKKKTIQEGNTKLNIFFLISSDVTVNNRLPTSQSKEKNVVCMFSSFLLELLQTRVLRA